MICPCPLLNRNGRKATPEKKLVRALFDMAIILRATDAPWECVMQSLKPVIQQLQQYNPKWKEFRSNSDVSVPARGMSSDDLEFCLSFS